MKPGVFVIPLLGIIHVAHSYMADTIFFYGKALLDFDEEDPFFETVSKPEEISPMELRMLRKRRPRQSLYDLGTNVPMVGDERNFPDTDGLDDSNKKEQAVLKRFVPQNLEYRDVDFGTLNPFLGDKNYFGERNHFRSLDSRVNTGFNIIATPYTKINWEPNVLRTIAD